MSLFNSKKAAAVANIAETKKAAAVLGIAIGLFFAQAASAATAEALAQTIQNYHDGYGESLYAAVDGNTVTVTASGAMTHAQNMLSLTIDAGVTVIWKAELASTNTYSGYLISKSGAGILEVQSGRIEHTGSGRAISIDGLTSTGGGTVNITGGEVKATTGYALYISNGTVNIIGGEVSATTGYAVWNYNYNYYERNSVNISGGEVKATTGYAVWNHTRGKITVSGNAKITSANANVAQGTIYFNNQAAQARLEISGGTVENTTATGNAIYNASTGIVKITGGTVSAVAAGRAVYLTNGLLFIHAAAISNAYTATDDAAIVAWNQAAGVTTYTAYTSANIVSNSGTTAKWLNKDGAAGIDYVKNANAGFVALEVTVNKAAAPAVTFPTANAITYDPAKTLATVELNGGAGDGTFAWESKTTVPSANNSGYNVVFTPSDADNYDYTGISLVKSVPLTVAKASGTFPTIQTMYVFYTPELKLSELNVSLPAGCVWDAPATVLNAGDQQVFAATFTHPSGNYASASGNVIVYVTKATGARVDAPWVESKTHNSITITAVPAPDNGQAVEYAISTFSTAPVTNASAWETDWTFFSGLRPQTDYYIFARAAENANYNAGAVSDLSCWARTDASTPIYNAKKSDGKQGVRFLSGSIVSDKAEFEVVLLNEKVAEVKVAIYDNVGNVVFEKTERGAKVVSWDLTNLAGRNVGNGGYLVVAEVKGVSGKTYAYSAKVGVKR